jgi:hypothetical protein
MLTTVNNTLQHHGEYEAAEAMERLVLGDRER